jgi:hypothetical protein
MEKLKVKVFESIKLFLNESFENMFLHPTTWVMSFIVVVYGILMPIFLIITFFLEGSTNYRIFILILPIPLWFFSIIYIACLKKIDLDLRHLIIVAITVTFYLISKNIAF